MVPFTDIIRQCRNGQIAQRLTEELQEVVKAVDATGKAGELTIKIKVNPDKGGGAQKNLAFDIKAKTPTHPVPDALFWSTADGDLLRTDPTQQEMFSDGETFRDRSRA